MDHQIDKRQPINTDVKCTNGVKNCEYQGRSHTISTITETLPDNCTICVDGEKIEKILKYQECIFDRIARIESKFSKLEEIEEIYTEELNKFYTESGTSNTNSNGSEYVKYVPINNAASSIENKSTMNYKKNGDIEEEEEKEKEGVISMTEDNKKEIEDDDYDDGNELWWCCCFL